METLNNLERKLKSLNAKFKHFPAFHLDEIKTEIEELKITGRIDAQLYEKYLDYFQSDYSNIDLKKKSVIVIAVPQEISLVSFQINSKTIKAIIPPTYLYRDVIRKSEDILIEIYGSEKAKLLRAPVKLLTVRSGLGKYGKNNICYIDGMGSFVRLISFLIDYPTEDYNWHEKEMLAECNGCNRCIENCPTHCISSDDFLIDAANCLTYYNENPTDTINTLNPTAHNSLVGCMRCQLICPANRPYINNKSLITQFDKKETKLILNNRIDTSPNLVEKLYKLDMDEYKDVLSRNLKLLIQN